ncbi:MAG: hypothetical protein NZ933_09260, partial [Bacteroidia bacterium]|nr:hypothetical protein [Bacteroidia bacterium]
EVVQLLIPNPELLRPYRHQIKSILQRAGQLELNSPFRKEIDDIVFSVLGLTTSEREAVYEAVVELVSARLRKAESVKGGRKTSKL